MNVNFRVAVILPIAWTILCSSLWSQPESLDHEQIKNSVDQMFEGMKSGDSAKVHGVMNDAVIFQSTALKNGKPELFTGSLDRFLNAVGTPHEKVWDERISNLAIQIDGPLATAWMDYSFYLGEDFSHCGVNAMTFFKFPDGWKIIYLIDTRRKENCNSN